MDNDRDGSVDEPLLTCPDDLVLVHDPATDLECPVVEYEVVVSDNCGEGGDGAAVVRLSERVALSSWNHSESLFYYRGVTCDFDVDYSSKWPGNEPWRGWGDNNCDGNVDENHPVNNWCETGVLDEAAEARPHAGQTLKASARPTTSRRPSLVSR